MATVLDIVERAHRKLGVKAADEQLTAEQLSDGVDALNMMLAGWRLQGVDVVPYDAEATAPFPLSYEFEEGAVYLLASRLAPDFMVPVGFDADSFMRTIQAAYLRIEEATIPGGLRRTSSQRRVGR